MYVPTLTLRSHPQHHVFFTLASIKSGLYNKWKVLFVSLAHMQDKVLLSQLYMAFN